MRVGVGGMLLLVVLSVVFKKDLVTPFANDLGEECHDPAVMAALGAVALGALALFPTPAAAGQVEPWRAIPQGYAADGIGDSMYEMLGYDRASEFMSFGDINRLVHPDDGDLYALADQQIAGVTMASEQAIVLFAALAFFLLRFFDEEGSADAYRVPTVPSSGSRRSP